LVEGTFSDNATVRRNAARDLGGLGERAVPSIPFLIRLLNDHPIESPYPAFPSEYAIAALYRMGKHAVDPLIVVLENDDRARRNAAAELLGQLGDSRAIVPLIGALRRAASEPQDAESRFSQDVMMQVLAGFKDPQAIPALVAVLNDKRRHDWIRGRAARALGQFQNPRVIDVLVRVLRDESDSAAVRFEAAVALGYTKDPQATGVLLDMFQCMNERVREGVLWGLGRSEDPRAVKPLIALLSNKQEEVTIRGAAAVGLGRVGDAPAVDALLKAGSDKDEQPRVRMSIVMALALSEDARAAQRVFAALDDDSEAVSHAAALALRDIRCRDALEGLIDALKHKNPTARRNAAQALTGVKDRRAIEPLRTLLNDPDVSVRFPARVALESMRGAVNPLDVLDERTQDYAVWFYNDAEDRFAILGP
jgi:HEAT repeat protein